MNTHEIPSKEEGYRFVKFSEVLKGGDEFWDAFEKEWVEMSESSIGFRLDLPSVGHFRRPSKK